MNEVMTADNIARVIQLAIAPVFLLTAIAGMLGVMTNRLHRVIDRARYWEAKLETEQEPQVREHHNGHLVILSKRAKLIGYSITLCTAAALFICTLIATLFLESFIIININSAIAVLFVLSMILLVIALICFLNEIFIGTRSLRIGPH